MRPTILVTEASNFSETAAQRLADAGEVILADLDRGQLLESVSRADVIVIRLRHKIDRKVMDAAPNLKLIATPTTGLNHIDLQEAERRGIQVISLRGETDFLDQIYATAEHTVALIFALLRHIPAAQNHVVAGGWNRDLFRGRELHRKTAGIVGYGRVGRMVAGFLQALGMTVIATDPAPARQPDANIKLVPLSQLLERAELVTLHVSLTDKTVGFFGEREFKHMRHGAWFINTSRGELINENTLLRALVSGHLAGAALDVLSDESSFGMGNHPLVAYARAHQNLLITPHIGGCTTESMEKTEIFLADKVAAFIESHSEAMFAEARKPEVLR